MGNTPEVRFKTQEELEYWGGYFGARLRPYLAANRRQYRQGKTRTNYEPRLNVFDIRSQRLEVIEQSFGGRINRNSPGRTRDQNLHPKAQNEPGFTLQINRINDVLGLLEELQPSLVYGHEVTQTIIDFLVMKQERAANSPSAFQVTQETLAERETEDKEFIQKYDSAREEVFHVRRPLTIANVAGIFDATSVIYLSKSKKTGTHSPEYWLRGKMSMPLTHRPLLEAIQESYGGIILRGDAGDDQNTRIFLEFRGMENLRAIIEPISLHLRILRRQVELALAFMDFQNDINGGIRKTAGRRRRGNLAETLMRYSKHDIDLVTMTREGFYSEMYRLNNE